MAKGDLKKKFGPWILSSILGPKWLRWAWAGKTSWNAPLCYDINLAYVNCNTLCTGMVGEAFLENICKPAQTYTHRHISMAFYLLSDITWSIEAGTWPWSQSPLARLLEWLPLILRFDSESSWLFHSFAFISLGATTQREIIALMSLTLSEHSIWMQGVRFPVVTVCLWALSESKSHRDIGMSEEGRSTL